MRTVLLLATAAVVFSALGCIKRPMAPAAVSGPLDETSGAMKSLRQFVADPLPSGTTLVHDEHEAAWDGTVADYWIFDHPIGFSALKQPSGNRKAYSMPSDTTCLVLENRLTPLNVKLEGQQPNGVWSLDWDNTAPKTSVRGTICPYADGEILFIERITLD